MPHQREKCASVGSAPVGLWRLFFSFWVALLKGIEDEDKLGQEPGAGVWLARVSELSRDSCSTFIEMDFFNCFRSARIPAKGDPLERISPRTEDTLAV